MTHAIGHILGTIPAFDPEVRAPTREDHLGLGRLDPLAVALEFQTRFLGFLRVERIELSGKLQDACLLGIKSERDDLITLDQHRRRARTGGTLLLAFGRGTRLPPGTDRQRVEARKLLSERLDRMGRWNRCA